MSIRKYNFFLIDLSATKASAGARGLAQAKFSLFSDNFTVIQIGGDDLDKDSLFEILVLLGALEYKIESLAKNLNEQKNRIQLNEVSMCQ